MTDVLGALSDLMQTNMWLAPLLAFVAGVLTSFMPCSLSAIPLVIGYVGGTGQKSTQRAFRLSLTFALGTAITFTAFGAPQTYTLCGRTWFRDMWKGFC